MDFRKREAGDQQTALRDIHAGEVFDFQGMYYLKLRASSCARLGNSVQLSSGTLEEISMSEPVLLFINPVLYYDRKG